MFIRKRSRKLKNGKISTTYQAVESFRYEKKVRQKVISLGEFSNPKDALKKEIEYMEKAREQASFPVDKYKELKHVTGLGLQLLAVPLKEAEKRRQKWQKRYEKHQERVRKLEEIVFKYMQDVVSSSDTTDFDDKRLKSEAKKNHKLLRGIVRIYE